jgi:hypothetical protein
MVSNKELQERLDALESKQRGTAKSIEKVENIQAGIGVNALVFQRVRNYIMATLLGMFGIGYIIYNASVERDAHTKEIGYVLGGICLVIAIAMVLIFQWYSGFVTNNKKAQVFNAFLIESEMLAGRR